MKIAISYPPIESKKGIAFLAQNRQFQWAKTAWAAYPVVPAYAATLLKKAGFEVFWDDGINQGLNYQQWEKRIIKERPDLIVIESKTPVIKQHWEMIDNLKKRVLEIGNWKLKIALAGDHVSALPKESMENCQTDYALTGGDYDFLLLNLCRHLAKNEKLEPGIWHRENNEIKNTGPFILNHNLDELPFLDRDLTKWQIYAYKNSNYCQTPGTYTMFARDCYWAGCSFCSWAHNLYPKNQYRVMSVQRALDEIGHIIKNYPIKEIMDDSGTFPNNDWLRQFCQGMIKRGYNKKVRINCNMRFNAGLNQADYELMGRAGFRFLLYGLESANQKTLDRLNKDLKLAQIELNLKWAKQAGLWPHLTVMAGFPWEHKNDAQETLKFVKKIFKKGLADTLQATIIIPYPGTPLFSEAKEKNWLKTLDWQKYDMKEPILKTKMSDKEIKKLVRHFYWAVFSPSFVWRKIKQVFFEPDILLYYFRLGFKFFSKLGDFSLK